MTSLIHEFHGPEEDRRAKLYGGELLLYSPRPSTLALVEFARELIAEAFGDLDPRVAQHSIQVEDYVQILARLKPKFINHPTSRDLVRGIITDLGCDPGKTYFDLPRMRTAASGDYLRSGLAYAFHPHRDTWYSAPMSQINWWLPIYEIEPGNAMAFHTRYWSSPIANESQEFDYSEYVQTARKHAAKYITKDTRKQPHPLQPVEPEPQVRVVPPVGGILLFSAAHLHSTVPNSTGRTRFSIDFRTTDVDDVAARSGAPNLDSECTGTALRDFMRASDLSGIPEALALPHEKAAEIRPSQQ